MWVVWDLLYDGFWVCWIQGFGVCLAGFGKLAKFARILYSINKQFIKLPIINHNEQLKLHFVYFYSIILLFSLHFHQKNQITTLNYQTKAILKLKNIISKKWEITVNSLIDKE